MGVSAQVGPTTAPMCPLWGCPSRAAWSWVPLPQPRRVVGDVQGGLSSCTAVHVFVLASASSRHWHCTARLCRLLAVALVSFDLGFFHWFFTTGKKIPQKRHICVGDSAQTQATTAERGRECEVETEPDYGSTLVGS